MSYGVIGNTSVFGTEESRFEPLWDNKKQYNEEYFFNAIIVHYFYRRNLTDKQRKIQSRCSWNKNTERSRRKSWLLCGVQKQRRQKSRRNKMDRHVYRQLRRSLRNKGWQVAVWQYYLIYRTRKKH